jgi:hypothetical protein
VKYLVNQLELDYQEAQDQGYEFHSRWLMILIAFVSWEMMEGATFPNIESFEPLAAKFATLWYSPDMTSMTKMQTVLTADDVDFIIASLNDASLQIVEKQEAKKEEMYERIEVKL